MYALRELQNDFTAALLKRATTPSRAIRGNGLDPAQRLAIYRNNTIRGLTAALQAVYPVVNRLVGEDFFARTAQAYIERHPPRASCLLVYGEHFPGFLADFEPARGLPYLPDTARLDWFCHEAYHEADATPLQAWALADVPRAFYPDLKLKLQPSARLLVSDYPVLRIWRINQTDDGEESVDLAEGGCRLLIYRPQDEVLIRPLETGDFRFLQSLAAGSTLPAAMRAALEADDGFDAANALQHWLARDLISDFYLI
ncbi:DUF2063 domain-containing protein [Methylococcus sp. EFPC2]|uniref:HvfC/BufC N-terminal domain-containing protein n=1 Tax=Methylococcus sp. EFPC2 TaxID=2812648 RepID=UPI0019678D79|nr:DNA-binding domain-containing protein [Methylococcus sp. EFPC2]QSA95774.1 putative DNA-binding domain-containing protein [Methylococcus sp. EFPC2]